MPALYSSHPEGQALTHDRMLRSCVLLQVLAKRGCPDCVGSGCRPGSRPVFCALCKGSGNVRALAQRGVALMVKWRICQCVGGLKASG